MRKKHCVLVDQRTEYNNRKRRRRKPSLSTDVVREIPENGQLNGTKMARLPFEWIKIQSATK